MISINRRPTSIGPHIGKTLLIEKTREEYHHHHHDQHRWYEVESVTPPSGPPDVKPISDNGSPTDLRTRRKQVRSYDIKAMRKHAVSLSGSFYRRQRRRRESLMTVSVAACFETQEFFTIQNKNILAEKSDMEKLTTDQQPPEAASEEVISLSDLAGIMLTELSSAIGRGHISPNVMPNTSATGKYSHESELRIFRKLKRRKTSKRSTRSSIG